MPVKTLTERTADLANTSFKADLRYRRTFDRELEKEIDRYRSQTPKLFASATQGKKPRTILVEGDSWCRYMIGFAFPWHLEKLDNKRNHVNNVASPGDTASEMLSGKKARRLRRDIKRGPGRNRKYDVIIFSGGGNDLLANGQFSQYLNPYQPGMTASQVIHASNLRKKLDLLEEYYLKLIQMRDQESPQTKIYLNAYDFAQASGIGVCGRDGWLEPHLLDAGVPDSLHEDVVAEFLSRFERKLNSISKKHGNDDIIVINTQGTLSSDDWENEIHPTKNGFKKIAKKFQAQLEADFP